MPKVLVALSEVIDALQGLEMIDVAGERHVDGAELARAVGRLCGTPVALADNLVDLPPIVAINPTTANIIDPALEAERARLAALPPGPCVCSTRFAHVPNDPRHDAAGHVHPDGGCGSCDCEDYVDTTVRDPIQARIEANPWGTAPDAGPIPPTADSGPPDVNPAARPASNVNAFRPPSG